MKTGSKRHTGAVYLLEKRIKQLEDKVAEIERELRCKLDRPIKLR